MVNNLSDRPAEPATEDRPRILQVGPLLPALEASLRETYDVWRLPDGPESAAFLDARGSLVQAVVTTARVGVTGALIEALPNIGAIVHFGVGYDRTDVDTARARGVAVSNTPDVLTECVADLAVGALLDVMRGLSAADRFVRRGEWRHGPFALTRSLHAKRVGILGLGRIGTAVSRRLTGFGVEVMYHSRHRVRTTQLRYCRSVEELARACDALIITAAGGEGTRGLVSAAVLDALGRDGYLVNVSRGSVVDEPALVDALVGNRIAGAALDVFVREPEVPSPLLDCENAVLLPHIASATQETRAAMADLVMRNLEGFFSGRGLVTPIPESV